MSLTIYSTEWCGPCRRLKDQLSREGVHFDVVDIETTAGAEDIVKEINDGFATVPTLVFHDGTTMTNPMLGEVMAKLAC